MRAAASGADELTEDKKSVYLTAYEVLVGVAQLAAPFAPFLTDEIYRNLTGEESVHLSLYPTANEACIDENVEARMDLVSEYGRLSEEACVRKSGSRSASRSMRSLSTANTKA